MQIAGVNFCFKGDLDPEAFLLSQKVFDSFSAVADNACIHTIEIGLCDDPPPDITIMTKIFDGNKAWQIFKHENRYCFLYKPPSSPGPLWLAFFGKSLTQVSVHLLKKPYDITFFPYLPSLLRTVLMYALADRGGIIMHGSGAVINGKGILFCGQSGNGKTTLSRLLCNDKRISVLSDERIVVRSHKKGFIMSGTPWHSDAEIALNKSVPLSAICFIHHGLENKIKTSDPAISLNQFIPVATIPWYEAELIQPMLDLCGKITAEIPMYDFWFRPDAAISEFVCNFSERLPDVG